MKTWKSLGPFDAFKNIGETLTSSEDTIRGLRDALAVSPENVPLRVHLAQTLAGFGQFDEAITEYRQALSISPESLQIKLALADVYSRHNKVGQALVIVEDICQQNDPPAEALVVHAKLLLREGDVQSAVSQYKAALDIDPDCSDPGLSKELGVGEEFQGGEIFEGRVKDAREHVGDGFEPEIERPKIKFDGVGGMDSVKEEISLKILYPLQHPEMYAAYGKKAGGGILMYGPPGCGKTYLARATAGEIGAGFISVGISDVLDMWIGNSERNLAAIFDQARANTPCVLFFDEVDALGGRRSDMQSGAGRHVINQFLSEMDGVEKSNEGVLILAATNAPWHVDPAFRRPGRFDRVIFVPPPTNDGLASILQIHLEGKPQDSIDHRRIASKMQGFSGADIKAVVDLAIEAKLRDAMKSGIPKPLTSKDLLAAAKTKKSTTREWFSTAKNHALYSNQGGIYDEVLKYMKM